VLRQSERHVGAGGIFFDGNVGLGRFEQLGRTEHDQCERHWRQRYERNHDNFR
jgi:hypothetical protein